MSAARVRLCARGLHADVPENVYVPPGGGRRRCRACRMEYMRARRRGLPWDGPGCAWRTGRIGHGQQRHRAARPDVVARLRALVGACGACGWTPDAGPHSCVGGARRAGDAA